MPTTARNSTADLRQQCVIRLIGCQNKRAPPAILYNLMHRMRYCYFVHAVRLQVRDGGMLERTSASVYTEPESYPAISKTVMLGVYRYCSVVNAPFEALLALKAQAKRVESEVTGHGSIQVCWRVHAWQPETAVSSLRPDRACCSGSCAHVCAERLHGASHVNSSTRVWFYESASKSVSRRLVQILSSDFALEYLALCFVSYSRDHSREIIDSDCCYLVTSITHDSKTLYMPSIH